MSNSSWRCAGLKPAILLTYSGFKKYLKTTEMGERKRPKSTKFFFVYSFKLFSLSSEMIKKFEWND